MIMSMNSIEMGCKQYCEEDIKIYASPQIILELELETKAGSSLGSPGEIFPNE